MIRVTDASQQVRDAIQEIQDLLRELQQQVQNAVSSGNPAALDDINRELAKLQTRPTFLDFNDVFRGSGPAHMLGYVPDPGATAGTTKYLREDAAWQQLTADAVANTPAGGIAATDVQAALNELDTEKVAKAGDTMTGALVLPSVSPTLDNHATRKKYVDDQDALYLLLTGGTLSGTLKATPIAAAFTADGQSSGVYTWGGTEFNDATGVFVLQNSNKEIKVAEAGRYRVSVFIVPNWNANSYGHLDVSRYSSGAVLQRQRVKYAFNNSASSAVVPIEFDFIAPCSANDYFTVTLTVDSGSIAAYNTSATYTDFSIERVN